MNKNIVLFFLFIVIALSSCARRTKIQSATDQELYATATSELYSKKRGFPWIFTGPEYDLVLEYLKEIQLRHTFSPFASLAEIRTADTYFRQGEYQQAIIEYEQFIKNHPGHDEYPYAIYKLALSNYNLRSSKNREPSHTRNAVTGFKKFIEKYPDSELVPDAEKKITECRKILASREIFIGEFYMKKKNHKAALKRFNTVLEEYSDTKYYDKASDLIKKIPANEMMKTKE